MKPIPKAIKNPPYKVLDSLARSEELSECVHLESVGETDSQMSARIFAALDRIADVLMEVDSTTVLYRVSVSPSKQYQLWVIEDNLLVISRSASWLVHHSFLFLEGELQVRDVSWDEDKLTLEFTLFFIVHEESETHLISFAEEMDNRDNVTLEEMEIACDLSTIFSDSKECRRQEKLEEASMPYLEEPAITEERYTALNTATGVISKGENADICRCQLMACAPEHALEKCFSISCKRPNEYHVENVGYGNISVVYSLNTETAYFPWHKETPIVSKGHTEITIDDEKLSVKAVGPATVILNYFPGDSFCLHVGDKIIDGDYTLIECANIVSVWDDTEW